MKVTKAELKRRVSEAMTIINSPMYRKNPAPWLMHALHKVFYDGYVDDVSGLNSSEWVALQALRDGPLVYFTEGQMTGEVDWFQTTEVMQDATPEQIKDWEKLIIDLYRWLKVE